MLTVVGAHAFYYYAGIAFDCMSPWPFVTPFKEPEAAIRFFPLDIEKAREQNPRPLALRNK